VTTSSRTWVFDQGHATRFTAARLAFFNDWLPQLITSHNFRTALDTGAGVGYFSRYLADLGLNVVAFDGRSDTVDEARARHPDVTFAVHNVEEPEVRNLGIFDFVLCVGLLYHLENPFASVRNLFELTRSVLLIESMVIPGTSLTAQLIDEPDSQDQALRYSALIPSERCLVKMLYRAGFPFVYSARRLPEHEEFRESRTTRRHRTILLATKIPMKLPMFALASEADSEDPWFKIWGFRFNLAIRFLKMPLPKKVASLRRRLIR